MSTKRKAYNLLLPIVVYAAAGLTVLLLAGIIGYVLVKGLPNVSISLLTSVPSVIRNVKGILPYILNTLYVVILSVAIVLPLGVGAAVYLNEYAKSHKLIALIEYTTETLAGIPSIIYGLVSIPADMIKKAISLGVAKINVNTECQLAFADATRKYIEAGKDLEGKGFDPRKLLAPGFEAIKATVKEKMELFGSVDKA